MMSTMPRRRKDAPEPEPQGREAFQLPASLIAALSSFVEQHRPETSKSAVMRLALEEFLERHGYWPGKVELKPQKRKGE